MTTATLTTATLADQLNEHLKTQPSERTLHRLDLCDRCPQAAQAIFTFAITPSEDGTGSGAAECDIILCGHHMRRHLPAMLDQKPASYWIEPAELRAVRGVEVPEDTTQVTGDGLTDA